jgi:hypothetical protein
MEFPAIEGVKESDRIFGGMPGEGVVIDCRERARHLEGRPTVEL